MLRTHTCGELRKKNEGEKVELAGWVDSIRTSGKIAFIDVRDRYGITQLFLGPKISEKAKEITKESVIQIKGTVKTKPQANPDLETGEIEVSLEEIEIINKAEPLPLQFEEDIQNTEENKLKYRYLELRQKELQNNIILRSKIAKISRDFFDEEGFVEVETPILAKSTPEGARDYLVPSRVANGKFYALPQAPQQFKQMLMIGGLDRYYQLARCFRDEDLRSDRQPEFTQLDIEMSFIEEDDLIKIMEEFVKKIFKETLNVELKIPFPQITYSEAMEKYDTDRPDLRKNKDNSEEWAFTWVRDFPLFEYKEEDKRMYALHHPFTTPKDEDVKLLEKEPLKVRAKAYDLVLNGCEIGGGSIRNHTTEMQKKIFDKLGISDKEAKEKFGFLLEALNYGAPPHGGMAFGFDRLCMLMAKQESIRDVIAFPKTKDAEDLLTGAPSGVDKEQLDELGIQLKKK